MTNINIQEGLKKMFREWSGHFPESIELLPGSGSARRYYRLKHGSVTALGAYNRDAAENYAFFSFTDHFLKVGLPVPQIYAINYDDFVYLLEDLGDETLFSYLTTLREQPGSDEEILSIYKRVIDILPQFQIKGNEGLDYSYCYPRGEFDRQSMMWDLNYFKYYFLKLSGIPYDEQALENDFEVFVSYLSAVPSDFFMYRDFQSRNIMIRNGQIFFIDYQGGRKGALQYDIASLLWDAKAGLSMKLRKELFLYYILQLAKNTDVDIPSFTQYYFAFVYIRIMQALGAYGYRGLYERKEHFLQSIPYAVNNLKWLLFNAPLETKTPALIKCLELITEQEHTQSNFLESNKLNIHIYSFSYKNGVPQDLSGNGGGYVFDCRALPNPGRYNEYKSLTGKDQPVKDFLEKEPEVAAFFKNTLNLVEQSVKNYTERKFSSLMVSYGCTGGQHRSVYCAELLKKSLEEKYDINIRLYHREF